MRAITGSAAGIAALLVTLVPAAAAHAGGTPGPSESGGSEYGDPLIPAHPAKPVASRFSVRPRMVVAPALPRVVVRIDQPLARTVRARLVFMPRGGSGTIVRIDLGRVRVGRALRVAWPAGTSLAPGSYLVLLHARGLRGTVLARSAGAPGRAAVAVRAAPPPPAPPTVVAGHVFPVGGPHTYGDGIGAPRQGHTHQGQDILAAEGTPVLAPVAGAISFVDYQASAAGYYVVEQGADGYAYFFAHCQAGSTAVQPAQPVLAGQRLCSVGHTGDATGPHLHFEAWVGGWRTGAASHFVDPLPLLRSWEAPAGR